MVANAANAEVVLDELRARAEGFDAEVSDNRDDYALIAIQGPRAAAIMGLRALMPVISARLRYCR